MLEALARGLSPAPAARAAGLGRSTAYLWRQNDPDFAAKWDEAVADGIDLLEEEVRRRAVDGVNERPIYHRGVKVGEIKDYSDKLLIFLLKARRPEVYAPSRNANRPAGFARSRNARAKVDAEEERRLQCERLGLPFEVDAASERETTPEKTANSLPDSKRSSE